MHICVPISCRAHWCQRRALDPLELGLETIVICHMGAGSQNWVPWKSSSYLKYGEKLGIVVYTFNLCTQEAEADGLHLYVIGQPGLCKVPS